MAASNPEAIIYEPVDIIKGLSQDQAKKVAEKVVAKENIDKVSDMLMKLYGLFVKKDALLIEINPYAEDSKGNCKIN